jgi:hypothetical protein
MGRFLTILIVDRSLNEIDYGSIDTDHCRAILLYSDQVGALYDQIIMIAESLCRNNNIQDTHIQLDFQNATKCSELVMWFRSAGEQWVDRMHKTPGRVNIRLTIHVPNLTGEPEGPPYTTINIP